ncbi:MAG: class I SAM-dependent methyltransferase [Minisyncoccia bacterium]|jgi:ubiquinone/menaquinone biosynthesis C-methylase UbiE
MSKNISKDLFKGTAWYYARYRPGYPKIFFHYIAKEFNLDGNGRLLDLGCGTGQLAIPLSKYFQEIIAVDPEQEMLDEGKKAARKAKVKNVIWKKGSSQNLNAKMGKFHLVVMGHSFHWMDQKKTLATLYKMIEPGGGIVIASDLRSDTTWTSQNKWRKTAKEIIVKYLGEKRRAGKGYFRVSEKRFEDFIRESPFKKFKVYRQKQKNTWDLNGLLGYYHSMSFASNGLFGKNLAKFDKDFRKALLKSHPSGKFTETPDMEALIIKRGM